MFALYRKRPVVIEAMHWLGPQDPLGATTQELKTWGCIVTPTPYWGDELNEHCWSLIVETLEDGSGAATATHIASIGDYIIRGVRDEFYPCKPDVFAATYEVVDDVAEALEYFAEKRMTESDGS